LIWMTYNTQKLELNSTREMISEQNFQNLYFKMIDLLNHTIENLKNDLYTEHRQTFGSLLKTNFTLNSIEKSNPALIIKFLPLLRTLTQIFEMLENKKYAHLSSDPEEMKNEKNKYFSIVKSQLNPDLINLMPSLFHTTLLSDYEKILYASTKIFHPGKIPK